MGALPAPPGYSAATSAPSDAFGCGPDIVEETATPLRSSATHEPPEVAARLTADQWQSLLAPFAPLDQLAEARKHLSDRARSLQDSLVYRAIAELTHGLIWRDTDGSIHFEAGEKQRLTRSSGNRLMKSLKDRSS